MLSPAGSPTPAPQVKVTSVRCSEEPLLSAPLLSDPVRFNSSPLPRFSFIPLFSCLYSAMPCINPTRSTSIETCRECWHLLFLLFAGFFPHFVAKEELSTPSNHNKSARGPQRAPRSASRRFTFTAERTRSLPRTRCPAAGCASTGPATAQPRPSGSGGRPSPVPRPPPPPRRGARRGRRSAPGDHRYRPRQPPRRRPRSALSRLRGEGPRRGRGAGAAWGWALLPGAAPAPANPPPGESRGWERSWREVGTKGRGTRGRG